MNRRKWLYLLWAGICTLQLLQLLFLKYQNPENYPYFEIGLIVSVALILGIALMEILVIPVYDKTSNKKTLTRIIILAANGILYSSLYVVLFFVVPVLIHDGDFEYYLSRVEHYFTYDFHNTMKNYLFIVAALYAFDYLGKEKESLNRQKKMEVELSQTKLKMLKSQLQPHFLFNALNSVVAVIDENKEKAQNMLISLSDILRSSLQSDFKKLHKVNEELQLLEKYLSIEKSRYEDQLEYAFILDEENPNLQVPVMLLQPVVENAIKHGFKDLNKALKIIAEIDSEQSLISIKNNGKPLPNPVEYGTGLSQVIERMRYFKSGDRVKIYQENEWVMVEIDLS